VDLLRQVAVGDRRAFRTLYERFYHPILRFICRITRRFDVAEEGVNDVMLVVWRDAASFQGRSRVSTWIMGIAYRKALKLAERSRRQHRRFPSTDPMSLGDTKTDEAAHPETRELQDWLGAALEQLSAEHRAVVELTYYHGYSYAEIARIVDCPINTVKTRMFYARERLGRLLPSLADPGVRG
jgi:RNA polymerase sigma-70 factor (ECF subfamily)